MPVLLIASHTPSLDSCAAYSLIRGVAVSEIVTICLAKTFNRSVSWYAGFFVLAVINLGAAVPSSPGAIGVYHYLAMLALSVWVTDKSAALGYAIGAHGVNMLINIVIGSGCLARQGIALRSIGAGHRVVQQPVLSRKVKQR